MFFRSSFLLSPPAGIATALSVSCHAGMLALLFLSGGREEPERQERLMEFVQFLVPPDKNLGSRVSAAGSTVWEGVGQGGTEGPGEQAGPTEGDVPTGEETVPEPGGAETNDPGASMQELLSAMMGDSVLTQLDVDSSVARFPESASPAYPPDLLAQNIEGTAFVLYVVDTSGLVDTSTLKVVRATHPDFVTAVRDALPLMRFRPAILRGKRVRQLVQQSFAFRITPAVTATIKRDSTDPSDH